MSSNASGFKNEKLISNELNDRELKDINSNLQKFIKFISENKSINVDESSVIKSHVISDNSCKADIQIKLNEKRPETYGISIKKGSGNSIHQENISDFIKYIDELGASENQLQAFNWFINSKTYSRQLKKEKPNRIKLMKDFLNTNKKILSKRFLKTGLVNYGFADYIYYGTPENGTWGEIDKVINSIITKYKPRATLPMGSLSLQAWNRTNEDKRHVLQVKWTSIKKDLNKIRGE